MDEYIMKSYNAGFFSVLLIVFTVWSVGTAAEEPFANLFQRGNTNIRYHLTSDALQSQNDAETTFTLTYHTIDAIDAYFEYIPETDLLQHKKTTNYLILLVLYRLQHHLISTTRHVMWHL